MRVLFKKIRELFKKEEKNILNNSEDLLNMETKLGFGFNRLPLKNKEPDYDKINEMVDIYMASGCKYFEAGYNYMNFKSEEIIKKCLTERYQRENYILCDKMPIRFKVTYEKGYEAMFGEQLKKCGVDYFDVYLLHNLGETLCNKMNKTGAFEFLKQIKKDGRAKLIGFSFHDRAEVLDKILTEHPEVDIVQLQINYQDWESNAIQSRLCYEVAKKHGKIVTVMEPIKGGNLVNKLTEEAEELISKSNFTAASLALQFPASLENVAVVLSGMAEPIHAKENAETLRKPCMLSHEGYQLIEEVMACLEKDRSILCTNCGYCLDVCPKNIPINDIFSLMNNETRDGKMINRNANMLYGRTCQDKGKASDCLNCGLCEDVCSQRLEIRTCLKQAKSIFEKSS